MGDEALPAATTPFNKAAAIIAASVIDCIGAALYFVITLGLILLARRRAEDADTHTVTIHDYSVYVQKLPPDATSSELVDFFSQWGEVRGGLRLQGALAGLGSHHIIRAEGHPLQSLQASAFSTVWLALCVDAG